MLRLAPFLLLAFCLKLQAAPVFDRIKTSYETRSEQEEYLYNFYGMSESPDEAEFKDRVRAFQRFHHLPVTGEMDDVSKAAMRAPRCGLPDVTSENGGRSKRYATIGRVPGFSDGIKWGYEYPSSSLAIADSDVQSTIQSAINLWNATTDQLNMAYESDVTTLAQEDFFMAFYSGEHGDGGPFDGPGGTLAHAYTPGNYDLSSDVHFDLDEDWTLDGSGIDLLWVAAHEIGHSLGLGHSSDTSAVMYPTYPSSYTPLTALGTDDISGVLCIYEGTCEDGGDSGGRPPRGPRRPRRPRGPGGRGGERGRGGRGRGGRRRGR